MAFSGLTLLPYFWNKNCFPECKGYVPFIPNIMKAPYVVRISLLSLIPLSAVFCAFLFQKPEQGFIDWRTIHNNAFTYGEKLEYRLHYGIINAGTIEMKVAEKPAVIDGRGTYHIDGYGKSIPSFDWMFKVRDHFESYVDTQAMLPLRFIKDQKEGGYNDHDYVTFNYFLKKCFNKKGTKDIPVDIQDVISVVYYARTLDMKNAKKGDEFPLALYLDNEVYKLKFKYDGKETIKTDVGKINALRIVPEVVADRVFRTKDAMTIWVSDDENKVPLRIKAEILIGSLKCDITGYSGLKYELNKKK